MRIGVTGATGFIGTHLMQALQARPGIRPRPLARRNADRAPTARELRAFVHNLDVIFHLGGVNRGTDEQVLLGNLLATQRLLDAVSTRGPGGPRIVFTSSAQVYRMSGAPKPFRESHPAVPETVYGVAKKSAEDLIRLSGFPHCILRLTNVYGPGTRPHYNSVIGTFCDQAVRGRPVTLHGDGRQGRDFIYIDDVVDALIHAGTASATSRAGIFNLSSGKVVSLKQIVTQIRQAGANLKVEVHPDVPSGVYSFCCDSTKFRNRFGWKPRTPLSRGIRQTLDWYRKRIEP